MSLGAMVIESLDASSVPVDQGHCHMPSTELPLKTWSPFAADQDQEMMFDGESPPMVPSVVIEPVRVKPF
jgi:hypothetical protein